ncbi:hypothetical protein [Janthinobacterium agaricidamnosum]|uniref:Uncharacterized protein n=1 Tax=Janthinobacterium agaricidamnosum NBRC 102515 = DSM 9628 TaxID=1349767 RepID=W0V7F1_9BURK|nr:hypothetical protein [Janthinobacterium agaricidamnosum]CDG83197.1 hypothetical protein GJA_2566 [Janthinobacterium agaricidamnosum NBRC 102515 = DSM 9628]
MNDTPPISIDLQCVHHTGCIYDGKDILVNILIKNDSTKSVGFPLEFLRKSGPIIKFIDTDTGKNTYGRRGLANPLLKTKFTQIPPGATISMETALHKEQLESFKIKKVDITAEVIIKTRLQIEGATELSEYQGSSTIRIVEKSD